MKYNPNTKNNEKIIILGHENPDVDSIISGFLLQQLLNKKGIPAEFIIPDKTIEQDSVKICLSYGLNPYKFQKEIDISSESQKYILVDHHERELNGEIIAIIDHHPTNKKITIPNYYNQISSSTSCILCKNNEIYFSKKELELAIVAALVDTASFHSTKSRKEDKVWIENWCNKLKLDYKKLYKIGLSLTSLENLESASLNGLKKYNFYSNIVQSSCIQIENTPSNHKKIKKIIEYLKQYVHDNNVDIFIFIVHDMTNFCSKVYQISKTEVIEKEYKQYTSRGNTIIPEVVKSLKK